MTDFPLRFSARIPRETKSYDPLSFGLPKRAIERRHGASSETKRRKLMAIIGIFKATENGYEGAIETLGLSAKLTIEPARKNSDNQPDYRVFQVTEHFKSDIGAAWKKTSREGAEYLSVSIDDIGFTTKAYCRLVKTGAEKGHTLFWERPRPSYEE
jgi:uncharacterized protein (DUF736 family)